MLSNFLICLNAVLPLVIYLIIGVLLRRYEVVSEHEVRQFNRMVFIAFFPALMFENLYSAKISEAFEPKLIGGACLFVMLVIAVSWVFVTHIEKDDKSRGAMIQAIYRSNFVLMGLPIAINVYGKGNTAVTAALIMFVVPLYNVMAVIILEYFRGGKVSPLSMVKKIFTNPIILGAIAAIIAMALHITLPHAVNSVVSSMSDATTPIAMILLGASFNVQSVKRDKRNLTIAVAGRLIVVPAVGLSIAAALGVRGVEFVSLIAMMAAPPAVSSFTMAEAMDSNGELAGNAVIFGTPLSCITLFLWLFLFKSLGMF